ncbi:MAG: SDR family NAD(P)-dependent oxidoreductase [Candidatus Hodarchaeales archaeon]
MKVQELFKLDGSVALVTGGATGIGLTMAEALAEAGANVVICGRGRHGSLERAKEKLSESGNEIFTYQCDVSKEEQILAMIERIKEKELVVDILVNNAGVSWGSPTESLELLNWSKVIETNLTGPFLLSREVIKIFMLSKGEGSIINIASVSAYIGGEIGVAAYSASKAGLIGMTKQLAIEFASQNIRVNGIAPSWFPSYMTRHFTSEDSPAYQTLISENPMGRLGEPWELKGVIVFLASKASSYITGTVIPVDGGFLSK